MRTLGFGLVCLLMLLFVKTVKADDRSDAMYWNGVADMDDMETWMIYSWAYSDLNEDVSERDSLVARYLTLFDLGKFKGTESDDVASYLTKAKDAQDSSAASVTKALMAWNSGDGWTGKSNVALALSDWLNATSAAQSALSYFLDSEGYCDDAGVALEPGKSAMASAEAIIVTAETR